MVCLLLLIRTVLFFRLVRSNDSYGIVVKSISLRITRRVCDDADDCDAATEVQTINSSVTKLRDGGTNNNFVLLLCVVVTAAAAAVCCCYYCWWWWCSARHRRRFLMGRSSFVFVFITCASPFSILVSYFTYLSLFYRAFNTCTQRAGIKKNSITSRRTQNEHNIPL